MHVFENRPFGGGIHARGEIVEQQHLRIQRQRASQHDALLLPAGKAGAALGNDGFQPLRQSGDEVLKFRGGDRLPDILLLRRWC